MYTLVSSNDHRYQGLSLEETCKLFYEFVVVWGHKTVILRHVKSRLKLIKSDAGGCEIQLQMQMHSLESVYMYYVSQLHKPLSIEHSHTLFFFS